MKKILIYLTVCLALILGFIVNLQNKRSEPNISIYIDNLEGVEREIKPWIDDGTIYVFLPSYAELDSSEVIFDMGEKIEIDGTDVGRNISLNDIALGISHSVLIGKYEYDLEIYKSDNVATVYIETITNSMDRIYGDIDYKEQAGISIFNEDGTLDYSDDDCVISGRGNSTWKKDKKPFNLELSKRTEILGMACSDSWALLANAYDSTNIRDKIVKNFARELEFAYSPDEKYVDLYLNGEYNGLYMISEKVQIDENRLNISEDSVLESFEYNERWRMLDNPFMTNAEQTIEVKYPTECSDYELNRIKLHTQRMENVILGNGDSVEDVIDIDSWARMYLIDEVFENVDAGIASSFFYWSWDDGIVFRGPVWDYDNAMGGSSVNSNGNPLTFYAIREKKSDYMTPYYSALLQNDVFMERVVEIYFDEFVPLLDELVNGGIEKMQESIKGASVLNSIRWKNLYTKQITWEYLVDFLVKRKEFLNEAINHIMDYNLVYVTNNNYIISVKTGELVDLPNAEMIGLMGNLKWIDVDTGEEFDPQSPITDDITISAKGEALGFANNLWSYKKYICYGSISVIFCMILCCFAWIDVRRSGKWRCHI
jgi:hypothetical protein